MTTKRNSQMLIRNCQFALKCDAVWENLEQKRDAEGYPALTTFKKGQGKRFAERALSSGRDIDEVRVNRAGAEAGGYSL